MTSKTPYLIDTSALGALVMSSERAHQHYLLTLQELSPQQNLSIITTDYIIDEWFTMLRCKLKIPVHDIFEFYDEICPSLIIIPITSDIFEAAIKLLRKYDDHFLSFTDATTVALMKKENIHSILTTDHDFQIFGFEIL